MLRACTNKHTKYICKDRCRVAVLGVVLYLCAYASMKGSQEFAWIVLLAPGKSVARELNGPGRPENGALSSCVVFGVLVILPHARTTPGRTRTKYYYHYIAQYNTPNPKFVLVIAQRPRALRWVCNTNYHIRTQNRCVYVFMPVNACAAIRQTRSFVC